MAVKSVYLYQVVMGHGDREEEFAYCYARNSGVAVDSYKQIFKEKKYDMFKAKMFGEADIRVHPKPFEPMTKEEVNYIIQQKLANESAYRQIKSQQQAEFVPADQLDDELKEALGEGEGS